MLHNGRDLSSETFGAENMIHAHSICILKVLVQTTSGLVQQAEHSLVAGTH